MLIQQPTGLIPLGGLITPPVPVAPSPGPVVPPYGIALGRPQGLPATETDPAVAALDYAFRTSQRLTGQARIDSKYGVPYDNGNSASGTITFDCSLSNWHKLTLTGNPTLALSNVQVGQPLLLELVQDSTGTRTVTWFTTIKWAGGSAPTLTTTINKADLISVLCRAAGQYYATVSQNF